MPKNYGYARVSDKSQNIDRQSESLIAFGCDEIIEEKQSGKDDQRPRFQELLEKVDFGDTIVIHSLDRLMRSTRHLLAVVDELKEKGVNLISIQDRWLDTSSDNPGSDMLMTVFGALSEYERRVIKQRQREGIDIALKRGTPYGRPRKNKTKVQHAIELYYSGNRTVKEIEAITGVSKATLYRRLKTEEKELVQT